MRIQPFNRLWLWPIVATFLFVCPMVTNLIGQDSAAPPQLSTFELRVAYAKTFLDLAETELAKAREANTKKPGAVAALSVHRLQSNVKVADELLKQARRASTGGAEEMRLTLAEEKLRMADMELKAGRQAKTKNGVLEIKRLELRRQLAALKLDLYKNPEEWTTMIEHMQRQIDQFGEEVLVLDKRITGIEDQIRR